MSLTAQELKEVLHYDKETGVFRWRHERRGGRIKPWTRAGAHDHRGYEVIWVKGKTRYAHRLAWLYMTGEWPNEQIDHINMQTSDNSWLNLRHADCRQNQWNVGLRVDNTSGIKGVYLQKSTGKWIAQIKENGRSHYLGTFKEIGAAADAVSDFRARHHGQFARQIHQPSQHQEVKL